jgi:hypothetical protein
MADMIGMRLTFTSFKNLFYIVYIIISAFFLMNDYKISTLVLMALLAPAIVLLEYWDERKQQHD